MENFPNPDLQDGTLPRTVSQGQQIVLVDMCLWPAEPAFTAGAFAQTILPLKRTAAELVTLQAQTVNQDDRFSGMEGLDWREAGTAAGSILTRIEQLGGRIRIPTEPDRNWKSIDIQGNER